jgi:NADH:ubiquinone oxidoreductase subunit E
MKKGVTFGGLLGKAGGSGGTPKNLASIVLAAAKKNNIQVGLSLEPATCCECCVEAPLLLVYQ